ncbi:MAG: GNAT family N-acetyltransferase [Rhizobiaceae bacterium]
MRLRLLSRFRPREIQVPQSNLLLKHPQRSDFGKWVKLRSDSSAFLKIWEPRWPRDDLTLMGYQRRLRTYAQQRQSGTGYTYFLFNGKSNELLGGLSLTKVTHGVSRSATLGYWMGVHFAGRGHMGNAVPAILSHAFIDLKLNRVEAASLPTNSRSMHLLEKCGFQREGYAREYLEINGKLEDHVLFACLANSIR